MQYKKDGCLIDNSLFFRISSMLTFYPVWHIAQLVNIILYSTNYEGRDKLRGHKGRAVLVSNHTTLLDPVLVSGVMMPERTWHTLLEKTVETPFLGTFTRLLGGLPLPPGGGGIEKIIMSSEAIFKYKRFIHFYPEGECYIYNQEIRPFKTGAFFIAARLKLPVFPLLTTFSARSLKPKTPSVWKSPLERLVVLDPVYPSSYIKYNDAGDILMSSVKEFATAVHDIMQNEINKRRELNKGEGTQAYFKGQMPRIKGIN